MLATLPPLSSLEPEQVTLIERDLLTADAEVRKGVPQGRHVHALLMRGAIIMGEYFPDLFPALARDGAIPVSTEGIHWNQLGVWMTPVPNPVTALFQSRPFLEQHVRDQLAARDNVCIKDGCEVSQLCARNDRITGVVLRYRAGEQHEETLAADLVVDTSGRGSRAPQWFNSLGYGNVQETGVKIDIGYATRIYRCPAHLPANWKVLIIFEKPPDDTRGGYIFPSRAYQSQASKRRHSIATCASRRWSTGTTAWLISTGEDLRYPGTQGKRSLSIRLLNWYMRRVIELTASDARMTASLWRVRHLLKPLSTLFRPHIILAVLRQELAVFRQQPTVTAPESEVSIPVYNSYEQLHNKA